MVTRDDLEFQQLPPVCCSNCGFLMQFKARHDGSDGRDESVTYFERWAGLEYLDGRMWQGDNRKLASLRCWMRREFPGDEAGPSLSGDAAGAALITKAMQRDRSEGSDAHCPQFTPWVRHLDFREHWETRKMYLLERDRRKWEKDLEDSRKKSESGWNTRFWIVGLAGVAIAIAQVVAAVITSGADVVVNLR